MKKHTIALAGNPNSGKTTLFNALTGSNQRVGNWPGVTVERSEGSYRHKDLEYEVIDLPGIYSFSAHSLDEKVSRLFILKDKPELVVNIIDATNLERNLYLTTQLIEMRVPVVVALNMMDIVEQRQIKIEVEHLARHLDCPVVPIVANRGGRGMGELKNAIDEAIAGRHISKANVEYDEVVEKSISRLVEKNAPYASSNKVDARWLAVKLLEEDELAGEMTNGTLKEFAADEAGQIRHHTGDDTDIVIADGRYGFIHGLSCDVVNRTAELSKTLTDTVDKIVLNRMLGIPIFMLMMYLMFVITMKVGAPFIDFFDGLCATIFVDGMKELLTSLGFPGFLTTLLADGIGGGVRTVATFIPPIGLIFICLSALEDSGYMARAAFVMDRLLRSIGLPGKAFIPMLVGLGCNVPGIMATRTLENNRDRMLSVLINPLISCGARLPVYALFIAAFFRENGALVLFSIYFTGIALAILSGLLFSKTILKGEMSTFVMELPPYHIPTVNGVLYHAWNRLKGFMLRAGRVIIIVVIAISFLNSLAPDGSFGHEDSGGSLLSLIGKKITPVFYPMGMTDDNWPAAVGLFTGIFAKEAVVGTLNSLYSEMDRGSEALGRDREKFDFAGGIKKAFQSIPEGFSGFFGSLKDPVGFGDVVKAGENLDTAVESLKVDKSTFTAMQKRFPNRSAVMAYLLFVLIYAPCAAAISAIYRETNLKWTLFSVCYLTGLAWIVSTLFYQFSRLSVAPASAFAWIAACAVLLAGIVLTLCLSSRKCTT
ncbi:MAG: Fe(2+) transporter permease subunit FeoB [Victivallales bacterium]